MACIFMPSLRGVSDGMGVPSTSSRNALGGMFMERRASATVPSVPIRVSFPCIVIIASTITYIYVSLIFFPIIVFIKLALLLRDEVSISDHYVVCDFRYLCDDYDR